MTAASRSKNTRQAAKRSSRSKLVALLEPEQVRHARLDETALLVVQDVLDQNGLELLERRSRLLVLGDAAAHAHHVRQRPVGHALAVGEAPAAMPVRGLLDPVDVLEELPREAGLAYASYADDRGEMRHLVVDGAMEKILDHAQLAVAADERGLEALRLQRAARTGDDPQGSVEGEEATLALELVRARILVGDRLLGGTAGGVAHVDGAGERDRLDPRRRIDEVAGHHPLPFGADRYCGLPGEDAGPRAQTFRSYLVAE